MFSMLVHDGIRLQMRLGLNQSFPSPCVASSQNRVCVVSIWHPQKMLRLYITWHPAYACSSVCTGRRARSEVTARDCALSRVGRRLQASKLDKLAATGRFGLGFNAVYHFTDLPSLVSGEHLVMFDPHTKYVPGATHVQPGIKVRAPIAKRSRYTRVQQ